jgi:hypothetical protein
LDRDQSGGDNNYAGAEGAKFRVDLDLWQASLRKPRRRHRGPFCEPRTAHERAFSRTESSRENIAEFGARVTNSACCHAAVVNEVLTRN